MMCPTTAYLLNPVVGISSWCLVHSNLSLEEWHVILTRVEQDMKTMDACAATKS